MNNLGGFIAATVFALAVAVFYHAAVQRYEITTSLHRIDRLTGKVWRCSYSDCKEVAEK